MIYPKFVETIILVFEQAASFCFSKKFRKFPKYIFGLENNLGKLLDCNLLENGEDSFYDFLIHYVYDAKRSIHYVFIRIRSHCHHTQAGPNRHPTKLGIFPNYLGRFGRT